MQKLPPSAAWGVLLCSMSFRIPVYPMRRRERALISEGTPLPPQSSEAIEQGRSAEASVDLALETRLNQAPQPLKPSVLKRMKSPARGNLDNPPAATFELTANTGGTELFTCL